MATIRPNDNAPSDSVKYIFPLETFDLAPGGEHETEDRNTLAAVASHPWLEAEFPEVDELAVERTSKSVPYSEDVLSAPNSQAFNTDAVREAQEAAAQVQESRTAIESGLDQSEAKEVAEVNVTLAAAEEDSDDDDKPARRRARKGD